MQCPNCQQENEPTNRFCIFCGSPLRAPEAGRPSERVQTPAEAVPQQLQAFQEEIRRLRESVGLMNDRLATLERMQGVARPSVEPRAVPPPEAVTPSPKVVPSKVGKVSVPTRLVPTPPAKVKPAKAREWEQILGGNWLARVGVIALVIGVAFFLKFAFDNNWLGPTARVVLGIVAGLAMVGCGYYWQKKYPTFTQALSGGGCILFNHRGRK